MPSHEISSLAVIAGNYPAPARPAHGTFVRQLVHAIARQGITCKVIAPVAVHRAISSGVYPYREEELEGRAATIEVLRPRFLSFSARSGFARLGRLNPSLLTLRGFTQAAHSALKTTGEIPDAVYGHFLYLGGAAAVAIGERHGRPAFPGVGEGEFWTVKCFGVSRARRHLSGAAGFVANSTLLKASVAELLGVESGKVGVFPNGTDLTRFAPRDRQAARQRFGLPIDAFLVASVGNFLWKKGVVRVGRAIAGLDGVAGVYAGSGPCPPAEGRVALCRQVRHDEMPELLSACDVFVLPTMVEGSCNAIVEAMACGLPIISSSGEFNDDLLSDEMSIRVDPLDIDAIRAAIVALRDDPNRCAEMARAALRRSRLFDIDARARRILDFMSERTTAVGANGWLGS